MTTRISLKVRKMMEKLRKKDKAWQKITDLFNARYGVNKRTKKQLKDAWQNLKKVAKKEVAVDKRENRKTGGGEKEGTISALSQKVVGMLPKKIQVCIILMITTPSTIVIR